jgi:phosphoribosylanthranilate isomerase
MIVKVCGMRDALNIRLVEQLPIDWMGFIFYPRSPRYVDTVPAYLPEHVRRVGIFVNADTAFIKEHSERFSLNFVQLHGHETPAQCREVKAATGLGIIKAFGISSAADFSNVAAYEGAADYFLFDTKCDSAGGSGRSFDHTLLRQYTGTTPFLLSGGLGPESVDELRSFSHPAFLGIDLNSKFEVSPALKSVGKLRQFLSELTEQPL